MCDFLCFQLYAAGCDTKKELEPAPTEKRLDVPTSCQSLGCQSLGRQSLGRQSLGHLRSTWIALRGRACEVFGRLTPPSRSQVSTCKTRRVSGGNSEELCSIYLSPLRAFRKGEIVKLVDSGRIWNPLRKKDKCKYFYSRQWLSIPVFSEPVTPLAEEVLFVRSES